MFGITVSGEYWDSFTLIVVGLIVGSIVLAAILVYISKE